MIAHIVLMILVIISFILMIFSLIPDFYFWIIIAIAAFLTYKVLPKLRKEKGLTKDL